MAYRAAVEAHRQATKDEQDAASALRKAQAALHMAREKVDRARDVLLLKAVEGVGGPTWNAATGKYEDQSSGVAV